MMFSETFKHFLNAFFVYLPNSESTECLEAKHHSTQRRVSDGQVGSGVIVERRLVANPVL